MATAKLEPLQAMAVTDMDGKAAFHKVPKGTYQLTVTYVGYEEYKSTIKVSGNLTLTIKLTPTSLSLKEVSVIAQRKSSGASTTSLVSRQAIDHLQAASLADIMQLIPGQEMGNIDLTQQKNLQLRTLSNNATSAFGSSINYIQGVCHLSHQWCRRMWWYLRPIPLYWRFCRIPFLPILESVSDRNLHS